MKKEDKQYYQLIEDQKLQDFQSFAWADVSTKKDPDRKLALCPCQRTSVVTTNKTSYTCPHCQQKHRFLINTKVTPESYHDVEFDFDTSSVSLVETDTMIKLQYSLAATRVHQLKSYGYINQLSRSVSYSVHSLMFDKNTYQLKESQSAFNKTKRIRSIYTVTMNHLLFFERDGDLWLSESQTEFNTLAREWIRKVKSCISNDLGVDMSILDDETIPIQMSAEMIQYFTLLKRYPCFDLIQSYYDIQLTHDFMSDAIFWVRSLSPINRSRIRNKHVHSMKELLTLCFKNVSKSNYKRLVLLYSYYFKRLDSVVNDITQIYEPHESRTTFLTNLIAQHAFILNYVSDRHLKSHYLSKIERFDTIMYRLECDDLTNEESNELIIQMNRLNDRLILCRTALTDLDFMTRSLSRSLDKVINHLFSLILMEVKYSEDVPLRVYSTMVSDICRQVSKYYSYLLMFLDSKNKQLTTSEKNVYIRKRLDNLNDMHGLQIKTFQALDAHVSRKFSELYEDKEMYRWLMKTSFPFEYNEVELSFDDCIDDVSFYLPKVEFEYVFISEKLKNCVGYADYDFRTMSHKGLIVWIKSDKYRDTILDLERHVLPNGTDCWLLLQVKQRRNRINIEPELVEIIKQYCDKHQILIKTEDIDVS